MTASVPRRHIAPGTHATPASERTVHAGRPSGSDERALESAGGIGMIAGPDHPCRGPAGAAVLTAQVTVDRLDQSAVGRVVVPERRGYLALTDDAGREGVVPVDDPGGT